ncbi:hypothetical protein [Natronobacterium gregoryi]|uniref:DUF4190 domain-containing protein n=2 Tax=Natronobacterium gregoryi TaxID=44930 RepID=L0AM27_NATGS|nr:hypothetical protein [Natronobacterium gregoryi]AFZ74227.1 hypothetical protein Natgr_3094 [Natronobacterium gregoryi SP2]ELY63683.1 hypothetical protein C490_15574 [Natronobacterium gregoryi SP2]PLK21986.1 hypothetical protein CYV19_00900 [Natronobacterium gregoryi SP2]SFI51854.1 hypothetical protein SAMN05443661_101114 [Natronobacterium gregoryi]
MISDGNVRTEVPAGPSERVYIVLGLVCAVAAVYYQPIVFGPLALYFAFRLHRLESTSTGVAVALLGVLGTGLGFLYPA